MPQLRDPALLVPLIGAGVLIYLAVLPLFMLVKGSFEMEVAPREFVFTLKIITRPMPASIPIRLSKIR